MSDVFIINVHKAFVVHLLKVEIKHINEKNAHGRYVNAVEHEKRVIGEERIFGIDDGDRQKGIYGIGIIQKINGELYKLLMSDVQCGYINSTAVSNGLCLGGYTTFADAVQGLERLYKDKKEGRPLLDMSKTEFGKELKETKESGDQGGFIIDSIDDSPYTISEFNDNVHIFYNTAELSKMIKVLI